MEKVTYYAQLVEPYVDKYGKTISPNKKIEIKTAPCKFTREFYSCFGKDAIHEDFSVIKVNYPEDFTELDYVKKHHEIVVQYGHGSAEFESVPCKLFKKTIISQETIIEI